MGREAISTRIHKTMAVVQPACYQVAISHYLSLTRVLFTLQDDDDDDDDDVRSLFISVFVWISMVNILCWTAVVAYLIQRHKRSAARRQAQSQEKQACAV